MSQWNDAGQYGTGASGSAPDPYPVADPQQVADPAGYSADPHTSGGYGPSPQSYQQPQQQVEPYQQPQYGPVGGVYGQPVLIAPLAPTSGAAVASLILGILSITGFGAILGPVGLGFAISGMRTTANDRFRGRGLAIGGLITSIIGSLWLLLIVIWMVAAVLIPLFVVGTSATTGY